MKKTFYFLVMMAIAMPSFSQLNAPPADGLTWHTDILKAQSLSNESKKPIFAFFTGSDWCGWCHKLQRNVFAKPEFREWAKNNVVLLELDYPKFKQLPPELAQQNQELKQAFRIEGFPTIWMFYLTKNEATNKMNIDPVGTLGYPSTGESGKEEVAFLKEANGFLQSHQAK